jgi:hypothetical protein
MVVGLKPHASSVRQRRASLGRGGARLPRPGRATPTPARDEPLSRVGFRGDDGFARTRPRDRPVNGCVSGYGRASNVRLSKRSTRSLTRSRWIDKKRMEAAEPAAASILILPHTAGPTLTERCATGVPLVS